MRKEWMDELDGIFDSHAQRRQEAEAKALEHENLTRGFRTAFDAKCNSTIKPALDRVAQYLLSKGQRSHVAVTLLESISAGGVQAAGVKMKLLSAGDHPYRSTSDEAHISFQPDGARRLVNIHESTIRPRRGGQAGIVASVELEVLTEDYVEAKAAEWLGKVFRH